MKKRILLIGLIVLLFGCFVQAQEVEKKEEKKVIQFSGYILTPDTLLGIPFVNIKIRNTNRGTSTNFDGFFSFVASAGDTVEFTCLGFEPSYYYIPSNLQSNKYSIVKLLSSTDYYIDTVTIYPWPSKEMFKQAFLSLELEETDTDRALKNLEREYLKEMGEAMSMDASENANYYLRSEAKKYYYAGQAPPQNIFNVFAWAQFIEAWKRGDFKRKK